ncbi:ABC transporter substrate-binding protein [Undibacterium arcticum]|uniref:ABC transporter substrate-binding protein n=1 Tax=Undibacterium arcticum TaxID=1762892 RepID=A0ABV7F140_9BURK
MLLFAWVGATCPAVAADLSKTLRVLIPNGETGIDPATASDANTGSLIENIFDPLLHYDYLARPLKLQPNTVSAMPEVSSDGRVYTFRLRPGIYFTPDPAFKGKQRELTADDYVYSFKRIYDPALKSPWMFLFENKIAGDQSLLQMRKHGRFDTQTRVPGVRALDRYTLRIELTERDSNFLFKMAMPATGAVAREVMEAYAGDTGSHPVGTGPYLIKEWQRASRILLEANPDYREMFFDGTPGDNDEDRKLAAALRGKRMPIIGRIEVKVIEEQQPRVLGFLNREFDYLNQVPAPLSDMVLKDGKLRPELAQRGIRLTLFPLLQTNYMWMNMEDPVLGGYTTEKVALRRAIALSYNGAEDIRILQKGLALPATTPLPPDVLGYDPAFRSALRYDPALARQLLERFGYVDRDGDGYREMPDGKPLTLVMHTIASTTGRLRDELWRRSLDAIGIRIVFKNDKYTEIIKASRLGKVQMFDTGWVADFPDGENYFQLLYSANVGGANYARFNLAAYDKLYLQSRPLPESPERRRLYSAMTQTILAYTPWVLGIIPLSADVCQPWLRNYKRHPVENTTWRYLDIDLAQRQAGK